MTDKIKPESAVERIAQLEKQNADLQQALQTAEQERDAIAKEMLTPQVFQRLLEWLSDPKPASAAFTAGIERQIAYALEMNVLPEVKALRIRLANAEKDRHATVRLIEALDTSLAQSIDADAQAFEATLPSKAERIKSSAYPWGWRYKSDAIQKQFREFCTQSKHLQRASAP